MNKNHSFLTRVTIAPGVSLQGMAHALAFFRAEAHGAFAAAVKAHLLQAARVFTGVAAKDTAQHALENWISSSGHFETMIEPDCDGG